MIAALGTGSAYTAQAVGFLIMIGVTAALPKLPPAPITTEHLPISGRSRRASRSCAATAR